MIELTPKAISHMTSHQSGRDQSLVVMVKRIKKHSNYIKFKLSDQETEFKGIMAVKDQNNSLLRLTEKHKVKETTIRIKSYDTYHMDGKPIVIELIDFDLIEQASHAKIEMS